MEEQRPDPPKSPIAPDAIPGYRIVRELGRGGMATVYLAVQESLGRDVALKLLTRRLAEDPGAAERFVREARTAAHLVHRHIVGIYDVGSVVDGHGSQPYLAMEYLPGNTLSGGAIPPRDALEVAREIALALDHAHREGVIHRDIKPDNILRRADRSCALADFGIARTTDAGANFTEEGVALGTPHYMSPEQLQGRKLDGRSDLYSLGVVLWQLLVGEVPYKGSDGWSVGVQHISAPLPRLPADLSRYQGVVNALMAKDPSGRPQTGAEAAALIEAALGNGNGTETQVMPQGGRRAYDRPAARNRRVIALGGVALIVTVVVAWFTFANVALAPKPEAARAAAIASTSKPRDAAHASTAGAIGKSIAVLPFVDMSPTHDQEYFADGLSEEVLNLLAQLPQLRVIARTSSFSFKGKGADVATIANALNVASVLEGSVRKDGNKVRITAQLVRAADSSHLWSQTYDRELTDVFQVQDEIAAAVVEALKVKLLPQQRPTSTRTGDIEAYNHYLRGRELAGLQSMPGRKQAIVEYRKAIALDSGYAPAYTQLAEALAYVGDQSSDAALRASALESINKAIALAPGDATAYASRGWLRSNFVWDWQGAEADFRKALTLDPNNPATLWRHAWLLAALGRLPEAIESCNKANALDPFGDQFRALWGLYLNAAGDFAQAEKLMTHLLSVTGDNNFHAMWVLGQSLVLDGRFSEAGAAVRTAPPSARLVVTALAEAAPGHPGRGATALGELKAKFPVGLSMQIAEIHAWRGEKDEAFAWLDRAYLERDGGIPMLKYDPFLASLRTDPRYAHMLSKVGLPP